MSDVQFDPEDFEGVTPKMATLPRAQVRKWEKLEREYAAQQAELANLKREKSFIKAGIPEDGAGKYFIKGYDGPDDPDSIRQAAIEAGIIKPSEQHQQQVDQALNGHAAALAAGAGQAPAPPDDLGAKLAAARSAEEVARIMHEAGITASALPGFPDLRK